MSNETTYVLIYTLRKSKLTQEEAEELAAEIEREIDEHTLGEEEVELGAVIPVLEKE